MQCIYIYIYIHTYTHMYACVMNTLWRSPQWNSYILFFYACLRLRFPDVETNPGPRWPVPTVCRQLCSNVRDLAGNLSDLTVASSQYDILLCSETLVSDSRHVSELLVPGFCRPVLLCWGRMSSGPRDGGIRTRWIWSISPTQV